jgi:hypothetical protein
MLPVLVFDAIHMWAPTERTHDQQAYAHDSRFRRVEAFVGVPAREFWRR